MINKYQIKEYIKHRAAANKGGHGVHSPFVFDFINNVLEVSGKYYGFEAIEEIRKEYLYNDAIIKINDLGAGSKRFTTKERKISDVAKYSLKSTKQAELLLRIANYYKCKNIIEIGTSLGTTTMYLSLVDSKAKITTIEGDDNIYKLADKSFKKLKLENINNICGNFNDVLPSVISNTDRVDMAFIDGNHTKEATINYYNIIKEKTHEDSVIIFDDIYWSKGMTEAWNAIIEDKDVIQSIDLFHLGIVFFKPNMPKQNFKLFSTNI